MTADWEYMIQELRRVLDRFPSQLIKGEGFSIRLYARHGLRYYQGDREITLMTEAVDATDRYGRTFLVFPTYETQIYVPTSLAWDDGERLTGEESSLVLERICDIVETRKGLPRVVIDDNLYRQIWSDAQHGENLETSG